VVEDAEIGTLGSVWGADEESLEIFGTFQLPPGVPVVGMLLWNGDIILKAKLKSRVQANSEYEDVVDRHIINPVVVFDPVLLEYNGGGKYRFSIYPVEIGKSRKIRIRYLIPATNGSVLSFPLKTVFGTGASQRPDQASLIFLNGAQAQAYQLSIDNTVVQLRFGNEYSISHSYINRIIVRHAIANRYGNRMNIIWTGPRNGYYLFLYTDVPEVLKRFLTSTRETDGYVLEATLENGSLPFVFEVPFNEKAGDFENILLYARLKERWDGSIRWRIYNKSGGVVTDYTNWQEVNAVPRSELLPVLWAACNTLHMEEHHLGAVFGFVDTKMSLLALESDSLGFNEQMDWELSGVPLLKEDEIILGGTPLPRLPEGDVMFHPYNEQSVGVHRVSELLQIRLVNAGRLVITLPESVYHDPGLTVSLYDINGNLIKEWRPGPAADGRLDLQIPQLKPGIYLIRVNALGIVLDEKIRI
jgi:hypothetical protein